MLSTSVCLHKNSNNFYRNMYSRKTLDNYLSRALGLPLTKDGRLAPIDEKNYVLTLDFTLKMLNIHERYECGIPAIIEGETGVGKTALVEMMSRLWNLSWLALWDREKGRILDLLERKLQGKHHHYSAFPLVLTVYSFLLCTDRSRRVSRGGSKTRIHSLHRSNAWP